jgi:hypothetical protein
MVNILLLDIETRPCLAYCWGLFKENIGIEQIVRPSEMICFAAKWYGKKDMIYKSTFHNSKRDMLKTMHRLLDEADIVVHFNGRAFDIRTINKEFITNHMPPNSPYKQVDLIEAARNAFNFQSNKLDFVCQALGLGKKEEHEGFALWKKCMDNDPKAWERMKTYNIKDVALTEKLYDKLKPWIRSHPNVGLYDDKVCCPRCSSTKYQKRGPGYTIAGTYQRYRCNDCKGYFSSTIMLNRAKKPQFRTTNV